MNLATNSYEPHYTITEFQNTTTEVYPTAETHLAQYLTSFQLSIGKIYDRDV